MPRGDGTGPTGQGPQTGRRGSINAPQGQGRGRNGGPFAAGPGGSCVCPKCGSKTPHVQGQPCNQTLCPKCGTNMTRQ